MNFIKTATAVAAGIVLSNIVGDIFNAGVKTLGGLFNRTDSNDQDTSGNDAPVKDAPKPKK
tara:strand:+ start:205 stop:387 length:183 start_codon:yes stop_codon:yes gene_type:complete